MEVVITAVGPDNVGLADPIIHDVTTRGANIAEIQMYDHDEAAVFAMMCRLQIPSTEWGPLKRSMKEIAEKTQLEVRVWSPDERLARPNLAICVTLLEQSPRAVLQAIRDGVIRANPVVLIGNRRKCEPLAREFGIPFEFIGNDDGVADDLEMVRIIDRYQADYVILARYMRVLPPDTCWKFAGGRIINLHHGLLPSFRGFRPYHDAFAARMLTFGATCHFIVPELDAGNQTIQQTAFTVPPGTKLEEIIARGQADNEPRCLVEGVRRVCAREVQLHFHRVIARNPFN
ncbi:Formyltetrahydrofolate deformylase [Pirellula sp. SH-Sr6A]|uniref:formyltransferase family protein n=1 Tax=Pirellula sp. SH-Sr6A TaxID=1632865 RepID=UPI00078E8C09|nr:formyltransferase family protein [Pirellula sp. SH-Sr6A]AMV34778.1 Formyltetrahydrofolate deformylase [Pirellula sp. SH-Sr6A]